MKALVSGLAVLLTTCSVIAVSADLFRSVPAFLLYTEQYLAALLALALPLIYLHVPAGAGRARQGPVPSGYDMLAALLGFLLRRRRMASSGSRHCRNWWRSGSVGMVILVVAGLVILLVLGGSSPHHRECVGLYDRRVFRSRTLRWRAAG